MTKRWVIEFLDDSQWDISTYSNLPYGIGFNWKETAIQICAQLNLDPDSTIIYRVRERDV